MPRSKQILPGGTRLSDYLSASCIANLVPLSTVREVLRRQNRETIRERKLPREFLVYYVIALTFFSGVNVRAVLECILECLSTSWSDLKTLAAGESAISQGRVRLGYEVMRDLFECICRPMAVRETRGAWYKDWRLVAIDGSDFDLADEKHILQEFPKHSNGVEYPYPQLKFVALLEIGTRSIFAAAQGNDNSSEKSLALQVLPALKPNMLLIGDRYYMGYDMFEKASATGAAVLFRASRLFKFKCIQRLGDGSYLAEIKHGHGAKRVAGKQLVRVIEFHVKEKESGQKESVRLVTNILEPDQAPALELAGLYCRRWGIETGFREIKNSLKLKDVNLRSKRADLVKQEFWSYLIAHYVIRHMMHQAALKNDTSPEDISFKYSVQIIKQTALSRVFFPDDGKF